MAHRQRQAVAVLAAACFLCAPRSSECRQLKTLLFLSSVGSQTSPTTMTTTTQSQSILPSPVAVTQAPAPPVSAGGVSGTGGGISGTSSGPPAPVVQQTVQKTVTKQKPGVGVPVKTKPVIVPVYSKKVKSKKSFLSFSFFG